MLGIISEDNTLFLEDIFPPHTGQQLGKQAPHSTTQISVHYWWLLSKLTSSDHVVRSGELGSRFMLSPTVVVY